MRVHPIPFRRRKYVVKATHAPPWGRPGGNHEEDPRRRDRGRSARRARCCCSSARRRRSSEALSTPRSAGPHRRRLREQHPHARRLRARATSPARSTARRHILGRDHCIATPPTRPPLRSDRSTCHWRPGKNYTALRTRRRQVTRPRRRSRTTSRRPLQARAGSRCAMSRPHPPSTSRRRRRRDHEPYQPERADAQPPCRGRRRSVAAAGTTDPVIGPADVDVAEGVSTIVYAWGSLEDDNLALAVQTIGGLHSTPEGVPAGVAGLAATNAPGGGAGAGLRSVRRSSPRRAGDRRHCGGATHSGGPARPRTGRAGGRDQGDRIPGRGLQPCSACSCGCAPRRRPDGADGGGDHGRLRAARAGRGRPGSQGRPRGASQVAATRGQPTCRPPCTNRVEMPDLGIDVAVSPSGSTPGPDGPARGSRRSPRGTSGVRRRPALRARRSSLPHVDSSSTTCCRSRGSGMPAAGTQAFVTDAAARGIRTRCRSSRSSNKADVDWACRRSIARASSAHARHVRRGVRLREPPIPQQPRADRDPVWMTWEDRYADRSTAKRGDHVTVPTALPPAAASDDREGVSVSWQFGGSWIGRRSGARGRLRGGRRWALREAYARWSPLVFRLALRSLGDALDAEDVTQQVYISAGRSRSGFDASRSSLSAWIVGITRHRIADAHEARPHSRLEEALVAEHPPDRRPRRRSRGTCDGGRGAQRLEPVPRRVMQLAFYEELSHSQIAEARDFPWVPSRVTCDAA